MTPHAAQVVLVLAVSAAGGAIPACISRSCFARARLPRRGSSAVALQVASRGQQQLLLHSLHREQDSCTGPQDSPRLIRQDQVRVLVSAQVSMATEATTQCWIQSSCRAWRSSKP